MDKYNYKDFRNLLMARFADSKAAVDEGNVGKAQFPRAGSEAMIELTTRMETLNWVIEMLPEQENGETE